MSQFSVTEAAAKRITELVSAEGGTALRLAVNGGGCSGFQYEFSIAKAPEADDVSLTSHGATVLIDPASLDLLAGSQLDYVDGLGGSYFNVSNPNASSSCGCGKSFSV